MRGYFSPEFSLVVTPYVNATCAVISGQVKFCWRKVRMILTLSRLSKSLVNLQHIQETTVASLETEPDFTLWLFDGLLFEDNYVFRSFPWN